MSITNPDPYPASLKKIRIQIQEMTVLFSQNPAPDPATQMNTDPDPQPFVRENKFYAQHIGVLSYTDKNRKVW
jgi:hypothetical protein